MTSSNAKKRLDLVVFGEFFWDLVFFGLHTAPRAGEEVKTDHFAQHPGGGVSTTALVAAALGTSSAVVTRVGTDALSNPVWLKMAGSGISTAACEFSKKYPTATTVAANYDGDRMLITHDTINRDLHTLLERPAVRRQIRQARHLHLACAPEPFPAWISQVRRLRALGLTISIDIGWNPELLSSPLLQALLRLCHFVMPNELEACRMTGEKSVEWAAKKLASWGSLPVIKLGKKGCIAVHEGRLVRVKSLKVHASDTTGAGDAFNGGFLHGYLSGWSLEDCMKAGSICGALSTTAPGGSSAIPSRLKLIALMRGI